MQAHPSYHTTKHISSEYILSVNTDPSYHLVIEEQQQAAVVERGCYNGKVFAVMTSGGDSQGMNSALRAIVRMGIYLGCKVYFINEGYQGLVDGGKFITPADWASVSFIIQLGGTIIGSSRCPEFRKREGRMKAAKNLVDLGITNLIVIGGDGSLTGANTFRQEWNSLLEDLLKQGSISAAQKKRCASLQICGLVGSIDNDFCGTDMTIGTDSALHRILDACDAIQSTASSHQRTFIMEVMGRRCGYLALVAALASEADYVFIPEAPPKENWPEKLCSKLAQARNLGQRLNVIIIAEGATDRKGDPITAADVKKVIEDNLQQDTRITVLGHVQRGGCPSAFDRILACRMGAEAVIALMEATDDSEAYVISLEANQVVRLPLMDCVQQTTAVAEAMGRKDWEAAVDLRGYSFRRKWNVYKRLTQLMPPKGSNSTESGYTVAVMHIGAPACGMNAAVRSFVRNCIYRGWTVLGVQDGVDGFFEGKIKKMTWSEVNGYAAQGGANLGTKRTLPGQRINEVAEKIRQFKIQALLILGGFEAFHCGIQLASARETFPEFKIPICVIPCSISNNIPGSEFSIGSDTALNEITEICDRVRQSAKGNKRRVFIIETMGGYCGYLATFAGLAGAADEAYIYEEKVSINELQQDMYHLATKMAKGVQRGLIIRNERASENYNTDFIQRLYAEEGKGLFSTRSNILGHMQQGGTPSPFDRNLGTKLASKTVLWLMDIFKNHKQPDGTILCDSPETACMLGLIRHSYQFTPLLTLKEQANFELRVPKYQWWLILRPLLRIFAKHEAIYKRESIQTASIVVSRTPSRN